MENAMDKPKIILIILFLIVSSVSAYKVADIYGILDKNENIPDLKIVYDLKCSFKNDVEFGIMPDGNDVRVGVNIKSQGDLKTCSSLELTISHNVSSIKGLVTGKDFKASSYVDNGNVRVDVDSRYFKDNGFENIEIVIPDIVNKLDSSTYELKGNFVLADANSKSTIFLSLENKYQIVRVAPETTKIKVDIGDVKYWISDTDKHQNSKFITTWKNPFVEKELILTMLLLSALFGIGISGFMEVVISISAKQRR